MSNPFTPVVPRQQVLIRENELCVQILQTVLSHPNVVGKWVAIPTILELGVLIPKLQATLNYSADDFSKLLAKNTSYKILIDGPAYYHRRDKLASKNTPAWTCSRFKASALWL